MTSLLYVFIINNWENMVQDDNMGYIVCGYALHARNLEFLSYMKSLKIRDFSDYQMDCNTVLFMLSVSDIVYFCSAKTV
jgi:hypothetical protein